MAHVLERLRSILSAAYGPAASNVIVNEVAGFGEGRPAVSEKWHRGASMYVCYADSFSGDGRPLQELTKRLDHIASLGCRSLHILPFFESPRMDSGFDVSDYMAVDPRFGTDADLTALADRARGLDIHLFADLVCNHTSDQNDWFKRATGTDEEAARFRNYFIHVDHEPRVVNSEVVLDGGRGRGVTYLDEDGREYCQRVIMEGQSGRLPHWRRGGGHWFYHTFFESQLDLDFRNPEVFAEFARVVARWGKVGFSFRLDAIPFLGRDVLRGDARLHSDGPGLLNHQVVAGLRMVLRFVAPESVFLVEAMTAPSEVFNYLKGVVPATVEADLAYEFHLTQALWSTLSSESPQHLWERIAEIERADLPSHAQFVVPLRTHDELLLEFAADDLRLPFIEHLVRAKSWAGAPSDVLKQIADGLALPDLVQRVPGRTFDLLGRDPARLILAYALVASVPGCPVIYYGDEFGAGNDYEWLLRQTREKRTAASQQQRPIPALHDLRDMQRAPLTAELPVTLIQRDIAVLLKTRPAFVATERPLPIPNLDARIFAGSWRNGEFVVLLNLSRVQQFVASEKLPQTVRASAPLVTINGGRQQPGGFHLPAYGGVWLALNQDAPSEPE